MYIHIFAFRWKPNATPQQKDRAAREINAFHGTIPGLLENYTGVNTSPRGQGYEFGGFMRFTDNAAYAAYGIHPAHQALLDWLLPLIDPLEIDFAV